jgi:hypothetical protein
MLVERITRLIMLVHLSREEGHRHKQSNKNGPALAGYGESRRRTRSPLP